jgi:hypothetical protein
MLHAGKSVNTVQQILGHAAASTTVNIYGRVLEKDQVRCHAALDRMLRGKARNAALWQIVLQNGWVKRNPAFRRGSIW